ncbi:MAG: hypothetical protein Q8S13_02695 [Dehalococcoidia bacterium]|nr:hypothetical protein [Dehalococcoidia bacterium]
MIQQWVDRGMPRQLWIDTNVEVVETREPKPWRDGDEWIEPAWEDYVHYDRRAILRAAFGALADGNGLT